MLDSERVLALPVEARWLYVTILLSADDLGLFEATSFKLARRADIKREAGEKLLTMLADSDLVRLYDVGDKRYGFVPRFRQRIQIKRLKHPPPPDALMQDDQDAINKIKHLTCKTTVGQQLNNRLPSVAQPSEPEPEPEPEHKPKDKEEKTKERARPRASLLCPKPDNVSDEVWDGFVALRRAKKAPITAAAMGGIEREAAKARMSLQDTLQTCCARGWAGFKADWVTNTGMSGPSINSSASTKKFDPIEYLRAKNGQSNSTIIDI
jgi:hypothetical protein